MAHAILLISCKDQKGITASVTNFVYDNGGNILHADQHIDEQTGTFFMRIEWDLSGFALDEAGIRKAFEGLAGRFAMEWELYTTAAKPKMAIFVSKHLHCLYDILLRQQAGQLACDVALVISNHPEAKKVAAQFSVAFHEIAISRDNKQAQEKKELDILSKAGIDLIILARYHQILTKNFIGRYPNKIINIHHSFLPAFAGKNPYAQAYHKGVKIIGATSHYVTEDLDQGPIIEQDTVRISHRDAVEDLIRKGEDLEKFVLNRAIRWHLEHKILCYGNKTVIFD